MVFIHELPDWPHFRFDKDVVYPRLAEVRHLQGRLLGRMESLGFTLSGVTFLESLTEDTVKSSEIEGEHLDRAQVRSSVARRLGLDIGGLLPTDRKVEGMVEMMLDATRNFQNPLDAARLCSWHAALFPQGYSGLMRFVPGRFREGPVQVVSGVIGHERVHFEGPPAARVAAEMDTFFAFFEKDQTLDPVLKAAIAHFWLLTIHPFDDGNGRIARAAGDLAMARAEGSPQRAYSLSAQIRRERPEYYRVLEATQRGDLDITEWLLFFLSCLERAVRGGEALLEVSLKKARFWQRPEAAHWNPRQKTMLARLLDDFEGKLTSSKWAALAKCSQDTALRDIEELVDQGVLVKVSGGRSTSYRLFEEPRFLSCD